MEGNIAEVPWTEAQWNRVREAVRTEAQRTRVASSFLPHSGPLDASVVAVSPLTLQQPAIPAPPGAAPPAIPPTRNANDTNPNLQLLTLSTNVYLRTSEMADPEMESAMSLFRRAATAVARYEDAIIFRGLGYPAAVTGLLGAGIQVVGIPGQGMLGSPPNNLGFRIPAPIGANTGQALVTAVATAVSQLEANGSLGPFACILGHGLFVTSTEPYGAVGTTMTREHILPFVDGHLYRSSTVPSTNDVDVNGNAIGRDYGLVVSLAAAPVELVVACDISVKYLQTNTEPRYVFRVSEKIAFRLKVEESIAVLVR